MLARPAGVDCEDDNSEKWEPGREGRDARMWAPIEDEWVGGLGKCMSLPPSSLSLLYYI